MGDPTTTTTTTTTNGKTALCFHCKRAFKVDDVTRTCLLSTQPTTQGGKERCHLCDSNVFEFFSPPPPPNEKRNGAEKTTEEWSHPAFAASARTKGKGFHSLAHIARRTQSKFPFASSHSQASSAAAASSQVPIPVITVYPFHLLCEKDQQQFQSEVERLLFAEEGVNSSTPLTTTTTKTCTNSSAQEPEETILKQQGAILRYLAHHPIVDSSGEAGVPSHTGQRTELLPPLCSSCWQASVRQQTGLAMRQQMEIQEQYQQHHHHNHNYNKSNNDNQHLVLSDATLVEEALSHTRTKPNPAAALPPSFTLLDTVAASLSITSVAWLYQHGNRESTAAVLPSNPIRSTQQNAAAGEPAPNNEEEDAFLREMQSISDKRKTVQEEKGQLLQQWTSLQQEVREQTQQLQQAERAHHATQVARFFNEADEAQSRREATLLLQTSFRFLRSVHVEDLVYSLHVDGPIATIAGIRLGRVAPYAPSSTAAIATTGGIAASTTTAETSLTSAPCQEAVRLHLQTDLHISFSQPLLSGLPAAVTNTTSATDTAPATAQATTAASAGAVVGYLAKRNHRNQILETVSVDELNIACSLLAELLVAHAQRNYFEFTTANIVLNPSANVKNNNSNNTNDQRLFNTVHIEVYKKTRPGGEATGFSLFSVIPFFGSRSASSTPATATRLLTTKDNIGTSAGPPREIEKTVQFHLEEGFFFTRSTFGEACVAFAACVQELGDALAARLASCRARHQKAMQSARVKQQVAQEEHKLDPSVYFTRLQESIKEMESKDITSPSSSASAAPLKKDSLLETYAKQQWKYRQPLLEKEKQEEQRRTAAPTDTTRANNSKMSAKDVPLAQANVIANKNNHPDSSISRTVFPSCLFASLGTDKTNDMKNEETKLVAEEPEAEAETLSPVPPTMPNATTHGGERVNGFSVRYGSVAEAVWTLAMKELATNVKWCVEATREVEQLLRLELAGEEQEKEKHAK